LTFLGSTYTLYSNHQIGNVFLSQEIVFKVWPRVYVAQEVWAEIEHIEDNPPKFWFWLRIDEFLLLEFAWTHILINLK